MIESTRSLFRWGRERSAPEATSDHGLRVLREVLQKNGSVVDWSIQRRLTRSTQLFLAREKVESERSGLAQVLNATLYVRQSGGVGTARVGIAPGEESAISERVEEAIATARDSRIDPFPLARPSALPDVETLDRPLVQEPLRELERLRAEIVDRAHAERHVALASAELFLDHDEVYFENSQGVVADRSGTRAAAEIVVIGSGDGAREAENQGLRFRRRGADLDLANWIPQLAREARDAARAVPFSPWSGPVVIPGEYLSQYLQPMQTQSSAATAHQGFGTWKLGEIVGGDRLSGEPLTIASDATLRFGTGSACCDDDGVPAQRVVIVEDGVFRRHWADQQYAHYLGVPVTGKFANWVIEPGKSSAESLRSDDFLEVVRFSWLNPSQGSGDFAAEIRFGYLHRGGRTIPFRGGSVAGNVFESLTNCHPSRETVFIGDGLVPAWIRFEGLATVGA